MQKKILNDLTEEEFLKEYWNKKPLLIKNAVKQAEDLSSFDDFTDLSLDDEIETRMVYQTGGDYPWQAKAGPMNVADFKKDALWTLIIHNLDLINSDFFDLSKNVNFIPRWHFDDVMATVSKKGASVGAHIDDYSVFILQGSGRRKWLLQENPNSEYLPDLDIRLLAEFTPNIEWVLEPGDMVYIPPNVAHHGISLEDSVSYSMGFKSIRYKDLLDVFVTDLMVNLDEASFHDAHMPLQKNSLEVQDYVLENVQRDLLKELSNKDIFQEAILKYLTRPKNEITAVEKLEKSEIQSLLIDGTKLKRDIWAKMVLSPLNEEDSMVGIAGNAFKLNSTKAKSLEKIFLSDPDISFSFKSSELKDRTFQSLVILLITNGVFYFVNE